MAVAGTNQSAMYNSVGDLARANLAWRIYCNGLSVVDK